MAYQMTFKRYELKYLLDRQEKELIDALRCRNGNLEIAMCRQETVIGEL